MISRVELFCPGGGTQTGIEIELTRSFVLRLWLWSRTNSPFWSRWYIHRPSFIPLLFGTPFFRGQVMRRTHG